MHFMTCKTPNIVFRMCVYKCTVSANHFIFKHGLSKIRLRMTWLSSGLSDSGYYCSNRSSCRWTEETRTACRVFIFKYEDIMQLRWRYEVYPWTSFLHATNVLSTHAEVRILSLLNILTLHVWLAGKCWECASEISENVSSSVIHMLVFNMKIKLDIFKPMWRVCPTQIICTKYPDLSKCSSPSPPLSDRFVRVLVLCPGSHVEMYYL